MSKWNDIHFGPIDRTSIMVEVKNPEWQAIRRELKGKSTPMKYLILRDYLESNKSNFHSVIVVTNYVNALLRGGQLYWLNGEIKEGHP